LGQVAIHCRVSTDDQSCERQERDLRAFAKRAGHKIVGVFNPPVNGSARSISPPARRSTPLPQPPPATPIGSSARAEIDPAQAALRTGSIFALERIDERRMPASWAEGKRLAFLIRPTVRLRSELPNPRSGKGSYSLYSVPPPARRSTRTMRLCRPATDLEAIECMV
jgi:hypothetical protein